MPLPLSPSLHSTQLRVEDGLLERLSPVVFLEENWTQGLPEIERCALGTIIGRPET